MIKRGVNIISEITSVSKKSSIAYLDKAQGNVKVAIVMILLKIDKNKALQILKDNNENLNKIIKN